MPQNPRQAAYRILDANSNRASEGLRTLEEYARFVLEDVELTQTLKSQRHDLTGAMAGIPRKKLLEARDTAGDVGTQIETESEFSRQSISDVVVAAASRVQQSLRCLEEYSKPIDGHVSRQLEQIRYRFYQVASLLEFASMQIPRRKRLAQSQLYVLLSTQKSDEIFDFKIRELYQSGVDIVQLRDRDADDRTLFQRAKIATRVAEELGGLFIVNDRCDLAAASGADGVHVGQDELPAHAARQIIGSDKLLGISTHDISQVHAAVQDGADYIGCGPVFAGNTKCFDEYVGTDFLKEVHQSTEETPIPAFAIGGIKSSNLPQVLEAGFHRIAVTGAVRDADSVRQTVAELREQLQAAKITEPNDQSFF